MVVISTEISVDPNGSYDNLFEYDSLYAYYSSIFSSDTVVVTKDSYDPSIINETINFPSEEEIQSTIENIKILHLIDTANSFNNSIISYPQTTFYKATLAQVVNQTTTALTTKTVSVAYKPIPDAQYAALIEFFKVVENDKKTGREFIQFQLIEDNSFPIGAGAHGLRVLQVYPSNNALIKNKIPVIDTKTNSSIYKHHMFGPNPSTASLTRYPADPNGKKDDSNIVYSINRNEDGTPIIDPKTGKPGVNSTIRYRWFDHQDALDPTNIKKRTIGYGHIITKTERESATIKVRDNERLQKLKSEGKSYLRIEVDKIYTQGLRDEDIDDLLNLDVMKRVDSVQRFLGPERWNWLIENYPARAALLVNIQYNGGDYGIRSFPTLLYSMGLINNYDNSLSGIDPTDNNKKSKLSFKGKTTFYFYPCITDMLKETPFKPRSFLLLNTPTNIATIAENAHIKSLESRSWINTDTFIYFGNSPTPKTKNAQTSYAEIIEKTKKPFTK